MYAVSLCVCSVILCKESIFSLSVANSLKLFSSGIEILQHIAAGFYNMFIISWSLIQ